MKEFIKRFGVLVIGILCMSAGVALSKLSLLGTSPISSIPNVISNITAIPIGQLTIAFIFILVLLEALVLRRQFSWQNLLQLIPGSLFGWFIDAFVKVFHNLPNQTYIEQLGLVLMGTVLLSLGVFLEVNSHAIIMTGEGLPNAIALIHQLKFAKVKVYNDFILIGISLVLALAFTHSLAGVREGTLIAAFLTGRLVNFFTEHANRFVDWMTPVADD
ncbi:YczE/YyaS/YitT family protein [Lactiplantibacillus paraplantarum]|uniref:YczE/YyaS/YitT family protein n=1 Tax=Lactiplantibacillus paraplantarum TaxID=60520 RepID=UPI0020735FCF